MLFAFQGLRSIFGFHRKFTIFGMKFKKDVGIVDSPPPFWEKFPQIPAFFVTARLARSLSVKTISSDQIDHPYRKTRFPVFLKELRP